MNRSGSMNGATVTSHGLQSNGGAKAILPFNRDRAQQTRGEGLPLFLFGQSSINALDEPGATFDLSPGNRDNSADSRVPVEVGGVGLLPTGNLVGRVSSLIGSWDRGVTNQPIWTWPSGLRLSRFFAAVR